MNYLNFNPSPKSNSTALLESGCTDHFLITNDHCKNNQLEQYPLEARLLNGEVVASTHNATLDLPSFPTASRQAHILPGLAQHSLIYVVQMYDSGCALTFTSNKVAAKHGAATILTGTRDNDSCLWRVRLGGSLTYKILREGGDRLISTSFPNTLLDSCCVDTAGISLVWSVVMLTWSIGREIYVLTIIMSCNCRKINPCSGLVKYSAIIIPVGQYSMRISFDLT
jgi:hypothetical protein